MIKAFKITSAQSIVGELDKHIVGQSEAKRMVALALVTRERRKKVKMPLRDEIYPVNLLFVGATGIGKTEIARRLANLTDAPFIKLEATKFTEIGFVGRDTDSAIRDLVESSINKYRDRAYKKVAKHAEKVVVETVADVIIETSSNTGGSLTEASLHTDDMDRSAVIKDIKNGKYDDFEIEIDLPDSRLSLEIMVPPGMEDMSAQINEVLSNVQNSNQKKNQKKG